MFFFIRELVKRKLSMNYDNRAPTGDTLAFASINGCGVVEWLGHSIKSGSIGSNTVSGIINAGLPRLSVSGRSDHCV